MEFSEKCKKNSVIFLCRSKRFISAKDPVFSWYASRSSEMSTTDWQFILPKVLKRNMPKNPKITAALKINWSFEYGCRKVRGNFKWGNKKAVLLSILVGLNIATPFKTFDRIVLSKTDKLAPDFSQDALTCPT